MKLTIKLYRPTAVFAVLQTVKVTARTHSDGGTVLTVAEQGYDADVEVYTSQPEALAAASAHVQRLVTREGYRQVYQ